ncbi:MAG: flagellar basal body protein, partial [Phycisphaerae bacterium]
MSLSSALQIGKSALIAYQQALQVTGNNIANAGNPIYSRQIAHLSPLGATNFGGIQIGNGVLVGRIER